MVIGLRESVHGFFCGRGPASECGVADVRWESSKSWDCEGAKK